MKYLFITLKVQDGENEHTHRVLTTCDDKENALKAADDYASTYYLEDGEKQDDWYYFHSGTLAVKVQNVEVLSEYEYKLMSKIFSGEARPGYFQIVHTGFCEASQREEIQIHAGENGNVFLFQDDDKLGFIVDVYGQNDLADSMTIWEDDIAPDDDDETQELFDTCQKKYDEGGSAAVIEYVQEAIAQGQQMIMLKVRYEICNGCDAEMPSLNHVCLVCGQSTIPQD
jgi:hypothetical protein